MFLIQTKLSHGLVVVALMSLICVAANAQQPTEEVRTGTISGRVVTENGQPLIGASISITPAGIVSSGRGTTSDLEGNFKITGLENGLYRVSANSPAYVAAPIDLDSEIPIYRVGDTVRLELIRGGVITGTVTNSTGEPVLGVRVRVLMVRDANGKSTKGATLSFGEKTTDDRGIYRIYGLAPGSYLVMAGGGGALTGLNATDLDAPTFAPSSTRDTAAEIEVHTGEETTVDIRYRNEPGHTISGKVKTQGTNGASITVSQAGAGVLPIVSSFQPTAGQGFVLSGLGDGEYYVTAQEVMSSSSTAFPDVALSDPVRVIVKGADVTGLELIPKPLSSISGKIALEPSKLPDCQNKRQPLFSETMISLLQNRKEVSSDMQPLYRLFVGTSTPDKDGSFIIRNIRQGQYFLSPRFFGRYWYLKSMALPSTPTALQAKPNPSSARDISRNWTVIKSGERITGLTITLSEGAASIRGQITQFADAAPRTGLVIYLIPAERDKFEDPLRYFSSEVNSDGTFSLTNLSPGRYLAVAQEAQTDEPTSTEKLRLPDAVEARSKIRRSAESATTEIELKPCQNVSDYKLALK